MVTVQAVPYVDRFGSRLKILALDANIVVGWVDVSEWGVYPVATVEHLVVRPEFRNRGVDRLLVGELLRLALVTQGLEEIVICERSANRKRLDLLRDAGFSERWCAEGTVGMSNTI